MRKNTDEEMIKKLKMSNKVIDVTAIIVTIIIVVVSYLLLKNEKDSWDFVLGLWIMMPFSWGIGWYGEKKKNNNKIKEYEDKMGKYNNK